MNTLQKLKQKNLVKTPDWLSNAIQYECVMGSIAYGVANDSSDYDIYGFCIPKKTMVFPHLDGEILGFGRQKKRFDQFQQHHIYDKDALGGRGRNYDFQIFNIIKYFQLLMDNNPNMIDSLFVPEECVLFQTKIGQLVRENRRIFLHKGCYHRLKGYAFQQLSRMKNSQESDEMKAILEFEDKHRIPHETPYDDAHDAVDKRYLNPLERTQYILLWKKGLAKSQRFEKQKIQGLDTKFAYHILRLCDECDQILSTGDLNLQRAKNQMKAIRKGEWSFEQIKNWFAKQEEVLSELYKTSDLQNYPDEEEIKQLLLKCLEEYFGSLDKCVVNVNKERQLLLQIKSLVEDIQ